MTNLTRFRRACYALGIGAVLALAGCWGSSSDNASNPPPAASTTVPDSAGASGAAFVAFIQSLTAGDETSEPLTFSTTFVAPPEDVTGEPVPVT